MLGVTVDELLASATDDHEVDLEGAGLVPKEAGDTVGGWVPEATREEVAALVDGLSLDEVQDRGVRLRGVRRSRLAAALADYYDAASGGLLYRPSVDGHRVATSVLTRAEWLDLSIPLGPDTDRIGLADVELDSVGRIERGHAVDRLTEAAMLGVRITNEPLYRLLDVDIRGGVISGSVGLAPFGVYALTMDLLERELADALVNGRPIGRGDLPLRDRYLPDVETVLDLHGRLCAGGVVALCAIARPADAYRGEADYALLVQERSGQVVNAAGRLAVIPKGFHEPLTDVAGDARIGATLVREMEEELFGRAELDSTADGRRAAAPMHSSRLSEAMRWLTASPARLRMECTGFGFNLVSGNYEFACLVVIEDEEFWPQFGGVVEANWESAGLRVYSSLDDHLLAKLAGDESWSNEGLFAFLQGLRRLRDVGGRRVKLPAVEL
ncbi:hypothetical protein BLA60_14885 [Actinophytocola xinjiangensis]|uniref:Uncharacterized protein n=2 Tax=Actinophytocola xinjiangensis TaxID=485602 RepID=A0A7Z0WQP1_9PSEU|nr:hypothetical protein BLA60_14885 [Actinophytocola xinjiangensis]